MWSCFQMCDTLQRKNISRVVKVQSCLISLVLGILLLYFLLKCFSLKLFLKLSCEKDDKLIYDNITEVYDEFVDMLRKDIWGYLKMSSSALVDSLFRKRFHSPRPSHLSQEVRRAGFKNLWEILKHYFWDRYVEEDIETGHCKVVEKAEEEDSKRGGEKNRKGIFNHYINFF